MLKATLFVWCLLLATSSYNAQFTIENPYYHQGYNPYYSQLGGYPITDPSSYYHSFYHPMYDQDQYYGPYEDEGEDYYTSFYMRSPGIIRQNGTLKIGKPNRLNIAGRPSIGNRPNRPEVTGRPSAGAKPNRPIGSRPNRPNINGRPGKLGLQNCPTCQNIWPCKNCQIDVINPDGTTVTKPGLVRWLRRILIKWIPVLTVIFPNLFSTVTNTQTVIQVSTCTVSTTACAGRRRRAVIKDLIDQVVADEQLEREMFASITPE